MTTEISARSPADLIAVIPALLGFHPSESLVVVALDECHRLGFRMRVDLPPPKHVETVAGGLAAHLQSQGADGALLVAFSADAASADAAVHAARDRLSACGVHVAEALRCDGERYWSYECDNPDCCPPEGTPYQPDASPLLAEAVYRGVEVLPSRQAVADRVAPVGGTTRAVIEEASARVAGRMQAASGVRARDSDPGLLRVGLAEVRTVLAAIDDGLQVDVERAATLSVWSSLIVIRDVLWSRMDRENAAAELAMWLQVARLVVPPYEPAVLSLTAFAAWLGGDGALAQCALERAETADPSYSMARLVAETVRGGLSPEAWERFSESEVLRSVSGLE